MGGGQDEAPSPSKRVTVGHSLCWPLVSTLNGDHVRPHSPFGLPGRYPWKLRTENPPHTPVSVAQRELVDLRVSHSAHTLIDSHSL